MAEHVIIEIGERRALIFGLSWSALVDSNTQRNAKARARKHGATHYVHDSQSASVGWGVFDDADAKALVGLDVMSAAQTIALRHPSGNAVIRAPLGEGRVWLASVQDGRVISGGDAIRTADEASDDAWREFVRAVRAEHPDAAVIDGCADQRFEMASLYGVPGNADGARLRSRSGGGWSPATVMLVVALLVATAVIGSKQWAQYQQKKAREAAAANVVDPVHAWQESMLVWSKRTTVETSASLGALFATVNQTPLRIPQGAVFGGWKLRHLRCAAAPTGWVCNVGYQRVRGGTNREFLAHKPAAWREEFKSLDDAVGTWTVAATRKPLTDLPPLARVTAETASDLQTISPAFADVRLALPIAVAVQPPLDSGGIAIPREAAGSLVSLPVSQSFDLIGPARSLTLLETWRLDRVALVVTSYELSVTESAKPTLNTSVINATFKGLIYAAQ